MICNVPPATIVFLPPLVPKMHSPRSAHLVKKLERNKAAQARVLSPVNHAHSSASKLLHNAVVRESRVNHVATAYGW